MPPVGGRPRAKPFTLPSTFRPEVGVKRKNVVKRKPVANTTPAFAAPLAQKPFAKQQRQQRAKTQRAVRDLAPQPKPYIPVKKRYTAPERKAIVEIVNRNANKVASSIKDAGDSEQSLHLTSDKRQLGLQREYAKREAIKAQLRSLPPAARRAFNQHVREVLTPALDRKQAALLKQFGIKPLYGPPTPATLRAQGRATSPIIRAHTAHPLAPRSGGVPRWAMALVSPDTNLAVALGKGLAQKGSPFRAAGEDVKDLAIAPVVGTYALAQAAIPAITEGDTTKLKAFGKGVGESFTQSALAQLVSGHPDKALKAFAEHPVFSALDVTGAGSVVGRSAGALARGAGALERGALRARLAKLGSTTRAPLALSGGGEILHQRDFSKDLIRKGFQVLADKSRAPARDSTGARVFTEGPGGRKIPVLQARGETTGSALLYPKAGSEREALLAKRGTFLSSRANAVERLVRDEASHHMQLPGGKIPTRTRTIVREALATVVEGTVRSPKTFAEDLGRHAQKIQKLIEEDKANPGSVYRHTGERRAAEKRVKAIAAVLKSPKALARAEALFKAGYDNARRLNEQDRRAIELGLVNPKRAARSKLMVWAQEHMDARHVTEEEHRVLERDARSVETAARDRLKAATKAGDTHAIVAAREDVKLARERRIAVSGRHPEKVRAHEHARAAHARAGKAVKRAEDELRKAQQARARLIGTHQSRRGREGRAATPAERRKLAAATQRVQVAKQAVKDSAKARHEAKVKLDSNRLPAPQAALRKADGTILTNEEIIRDIERHRGAGGAETIAYLPHRLDVRGARSYHTQFRLARPNLNRETRTGAAYAKGTTEVGPEVVRDELAHKATQISKAEQVDKALGENALRHPAVVKAEHGQTLTRAEQKIVDSGGHFTGKEAAELAQRLEHDTGERYIPVTAFNTKSMSGEAAAAMQSTKGMELFGEKLLNNRLAVDTSSRARNVALVPARIVEELAANLKPAGSIQRFLQYLNKPFRFAVLAQPRWLTGNFVEPYLVRLSTVGSGFINLPGMAMDVRATIKVLKSLKNGTAAERQLYNELRAHHLGGLFIGERGLSNRRRAEEIAGVGKYGAVIARLPVVHQLGYLVKHTLGAYFPINRVIEQGAQYAAFGQKLRDEVQEFTGSWLDGMKMGEKAVNEAKRGLMNTPTQQRFAAFQDELLGQYTRFPHALREVIQGPMPFLPWFMASARFVFWTMPAHNSAKEAFLIHAADTLTEEWNRDHKDVPPGGLRLAHKTKKGGLVDVTRYTPYGFPGPVAEGDTAPLLDPLLPQVQGVTAALGGKDPFGHDLTAPDGKKPSNLLVALNTALESLVPGLAQGRRLREHGGTPYSTSTILSPKVKPGSSRMSAARRTFDPFRPTYLKKDSSAALKGLSPVERRLLERESKVVQDTGLSEIEKRLIERESRLAAK